MKAKLILLLLITSVFFSCTTYRINSRTNHTKGVVINDIYTMPLLSDLNVDFNKKVSGVASGEVKGPYTEDYFKILALSEALKGSGADVIIEPVYDIKKTIPFFGSHTIEVTVSGYFAKYENLKVVDLSDLIWINLYNNIQNQILVNNSSPVIKNDKFELVWCNLKTGESLTDSKCLNQPLTVSNGKDSGQLKSFKISFETKNGTFSESIYTNTLSKTIVNKIKQLPKNANIYFKEIKYLDGNGVENSMDEKYYIKNF